MKRLNSVLWLGALVLTFASPLLRGSTLVSPSLAPPPVEVGLLPPIPHAKPTQLGTLEYAVYQNHAGAWQPLVSPTSVPYGDCSVCKRGVSLNCGGREGQPYSLSSQACRAEVANGIGIRIEGAELSKLTLHYKNGTHFKLSPVQGKPDANPPVEPGKTTELLLVRDPGADRHEMAVYKIVLAVKRTP